MPIGKMVLKTEAGIPPIFQKISEHPNGLEE